ncbi:hypothetical protein AMECASPLE_015567, partial [Ameca splendens]
MFCPFCGGNLHVALSYCGSCGKNIQFLRSHQDNDPETTTADDLIMKYFTEGHSYEVIRDFLAAKHNIS